IIHLSHLALLSSFRFPPPPRRPRSSLFPYTTLFRSLDRPHPRPPDRGRAHHLGRHLPRRGHAHRRAGGGRHRGRRRDLLHGGPRSEEHTSELQSRENLVCRLLLEKKNKQ